MPLSEPMFPCGRGKDRTKNEIISVTKGAKGIREKHLVSKTSQSLMIPIIKIWDDKCSLDAGGGKQGTVREYLGFLFQKLADQHGDEKCHRSVSEIPRHQKTEQQNIRDCSIGYRENSEGFSRLQNQALLV